LLGQVVGSGFHPRPFVELTELGMEIQKTIEYVQSEGNRGVDIQKYVIMPNHVHMILVLKNRSGTMWASSPTQTTIPNVIRSLKILIAKKCGFSLWQRSYHDHIIRDEAEYQKIYHYIDQNPARWTKDRYYVK